MRTQTTDDRPTILVIGATGAQGGSVARHLLERGRFAVRALTRDPGSRSAIALREAGAEVVRGDLSDRGGLVAALRGCRGVFGVTSFWEHFEEEYGQGMNLVTAVAEAGTHHFVLSSLPHVHRITGGELSVPHFDQKALLEERTRALGLPATFVHVAYYYENFLSFFVPRRQEDGTWVFGFPQGETRLAGVSVEDVGGVVARIFERRGQLLGRSLYVVGDDLEPSEYAAAMTRAVGLPVVYRHVPREEFAALGFRGAEDLAQMFEFYRRWVPNRQPDLLRCRALYPGVRTFERWLEAGRAPLLDALAA